MAVRVCILCVFVLIVVLLGFWGVFLFMGDEGGGRVGVWACGCVGLPPRYNNDIHATRP